MKKRCVSLDDVAKDLGLDARPRTGALAWVNEVIDAVERHAASNDLGRTTLAS